MGGFENYREYMDTVNEELSIIPMIETMQAMNNLEAILTVPDIDVLLMGPSDLSINLDIPLDYHNPKYQKALDKIAVASQDAGVIPGMYFIPGGQDPKSFIDRGFKFFTQPWSISASQGIQQQLQTIKR